MMSMMKLPVGQMLPLLLLAACTSQPQPELAKEVFMGSPCVQVTWAGTPGTVNGVTLRPGPEEWSRRNPVGIYKADGDACRGELLIIPYTLHGGHGTTAQLYAAVHVSQPWFVGYARAQITAPLHYRRGMLALTADCTFDEQMPEYGVLKMAEQHPLVLVDAEGEPYTRCEFKPAVEPHGTDYPGGYFQNRRKGAGEWDGLLLLKPDFGGESSCKWFNLVCVEQSAPHAMPVVSVLQGLQRRGNKLTDASGMVHYIISKGALLTPSGRSFAEMELSPLIPVARSANSP